LFSTLDDGHYFQSCGKGVDYGPTFTTGDIIGCGLNFITRELFFTKNGKQLGLAFLICILDLDYKLLIFVLFKGIAGTNIPIISDIYPTMGMQSCGEMIDVNFGQRPFCYDIKQDLKVIFNLTEFYT
jgi:hypothetical protein